MSSWKGEVIADSTGEWAGNGIRLPTEEQAKAYIENLAHNWILVQKTRVVESDDDVNYEFIKGELKAVEYEPADPPGWEGGFADNH